MTASNRGKFAEGHVRTLLKKLSEQSGFQHLRLPDARAGSFQPTVADYLCLSSGTACFVEVKEVAHAYRLPVKSFDAAQRGRLRLFELAGARTLVCVHFSLVRLWRVAPLSYFRNQETGSWDMRDLPATNLADVLPGLLYAEETSIASRGG